MQCSHVMSCHEVMDASLMLMLMLMVPGSTSPTGVWLLTEDLYVSDGAVLQVDRNMLDDNHFYLSFSS